jgi:hypothetical protein
MFAAQKRVQHWSIMGGFSGFFSSGQQQLSTTKNRLHLLLFTMQ